MAICTDCGTLMHKDDTATHTCNPADVPSQGNPKSFGGVSGYSGYSGAQGDSGYSGYSGESGYSGSV